MIYTPHAERARIAFGPVMPGWGSWQWAGADIAEALRPTCEVSLFGWGEIPSADVVFVIKHRLPEEYWRRIPQQSQIVYSPVDHYGSAQEIEADQEWLRRCSRILIHCERLRSSFSDFAPVHYVDHHLKFFTSGQTSPRPNGPILWVGVYENLPPLVDWVNSHPLPAELLILTNADESRAWDKPEAWGFHHSHPILIERWSPENHLAWLTKARAAIDIKGEDFRQQHKPPTKAMDFLASGLPLAMNPGSSSTEHLRGMGFHIVSPEDYESWLSREYWKETQSFGDQLRKSLTLANVAQVYLEMTESLISDQPSRNNLPIHISDPESQPMHNSAVDPASSKNSIATTAHDVAEDSQLVDPELAHQRAQSLVEEGDHVAAQAALQELISWEISPTLRGLVENDLGTLAALRGNLELARRHFLTALQHDPHCEAARENLPLIDESPSDNPQSVHPLGDSPKAPHPSRPVRVAILSELFNWPSTGGGTIHTAETGKFLTRAGFEVLHLYAHFAPWEIGVVTNPLDHPSQALSFSREEWNAGAIQKRFREAVDAFRPDYVIITDSWNFKPLLADAVRGYRYFLRLAALENLCPLNNVRLLPSADRKIVNCSRHQLATPQTCVSCVRQCEQFSGELHHADRELAGFGTPEYTATLQRAFAEAEGVLVVNPLIGAMVSPYTPHVHVVPSGFDSERFPVELLQQRTTKSATEKKTLFFAGLTDEPMKGFAILQAACEELWRKRRDFELVATGTPTGNPPPYLRSIGWQSQADLPRQLASADILIFPTIAEEALGRSAVEAMGAGCPVIASRIGGLQFTVTDGLTGLLFEPGNAAALAEKIEILLDDPELRDRMGIAARQKFEQEFTWEVILERHYRRLLLAIDDPSRHSESPVTHPAPPQTLRARPRLGCVLAIRNRPIDVLERTLQTYQFQTRQPDDQVLLDYGSDAELSQKYAQLCGTYGWRLVRTDPSNGRWCLTQAYNQAVSALGDVDVIFKSDVDVLLDNNVLEQALRHGQSSFCQFQYITTPEGTQFPNRLKSPTDVREIFQQVGKTQPSVGEGLWACPHEWFVSIGGFDLAYETWGYEDHDLRLRADWSLPVVAINFRDALLLHQWHPPSTEAGPAEANRRYLERMSANRVVVRNGGRLVPENFERPLRASMTQSPYQPRIPTQIDEPRLIEEAADYFGLTRGRVAEMLSAYQAFTSVQGYRQTLGDFKTLAWEEAFLLSLALSMTRPTTIVEIGTQHGRSTRRILDLVKWLDLPTVTHCFDLRDEVRFFAREEAQLHTENLLGRFRQDVLDRFGAGLIFLDAHDHALLTEVIRDVLQEPGNWTLVVHDCSSGLCNPRMEISPDDPHVSSDTGTWERHVLARALGISDPLSSELEDFQWNDKRLRIFGTRHGLAILAPLSRSGILEPPRVHEFVTAES